MESVHNIRSQKPLRPTRQSPPPPPLPPQWAPHRLEWVSIGKTLFSFEGINIIYY